MTDDEIAVKFTSPGDRLYYIYSYVTRFRLVKSLKYI